MSNFSKEFFENALTKITFDMIRLKSKVFLPVGLELNSLNIVLNTDADFPLKDLTFAYYNPVDKSIHINIEDNFFTESSNENEVTAKLFFVLYHECMHRILMHTPDRLGNKIPILWNIAADYEIHNMWYMYTHMNTYDDIDQIVIGGYCKFIEKFLIAPPKNERMFCFDEKYLENIGEEIYADLLKNSKDKSTSSMNISLKDFMTGGENSEETSSETSGIDVEVEITEYEIGDGKTIKEINIKWPEKHQLPEQYQDDKAEEVAKNNAACNRSLLENTFKEILDKGNESSKGARFLKKLFHVKIDWEKILRNSVQTILTKTDYFGWNSIRTSSFLLNNMPYLPNIIEDNEKYGVLVIARDESGSMSEGDLEKAAAIIKEAKEFYEKIILIKHDHSIVKIEEYDEITPEAMTSILTREAFGGTSHKEVFEFLRDYQIKHRDEKVSCFISITDMESDILETQDIVPADIPIIYITPEKYSNTNSNIKGKVIPVSL